MPKKKHNPFEKFATLFGDHFGSAPSFVLAFVSVLIWLCVLGPLMQWTNTWQLLINTPTTIIELFAAITIQFVGNRIQRRQQKHEEKMLKILQEIQSLAELQAATLQQPGVHNAAAQMTQIPTDTLPLNTEIEHRPTFNH